MTTRAPRNHSTLNYVLSVVASLGALLCGIAWSLSSPVGSSPDDDYHVTSIWCADRDDASNCSQGELSSDGETIVTVPGLVAGGPCFAFRNDESGRCQSKLAETIATPRVDDGEYPGGFYRVMHLFVGQDVGQSVVMMRVFNVGLAIALFVATMWVATPAARRLQVYVLTCALIPLGWFIIASVNPSGWAVTGVTVLGFTLHSLFLAEQRTRIAVNAVLALVGASLALAARGDAAVYVGVVSVAVCTLHWRALRERWRLLVVPGLVCLGGLFFVFNAQVSSIASADAETGRGRLETLIALALDFPTMVSGAFGYGFGLGWLDTPVHSVTAGSLMLIIGFFALTGAGVGGRAKALAAVLLIGTVLTIPLFTLYRLRMVIGESIQPRYVLPLIPIALMVLIVGPRRDQGVRLSRAQAWVVWLLVVFAQSAAIYANTRRYVTGVDGPLVIQKTEWWWSQGPGPVQNWLLGSLGFAVAAFGIVIVSRMSSDSQADVVSALENERGRSASDFVSTGPLPADLPVDRSARGGAHVGERIGEGRPR